MNRTITEENRSGSGNFKGGSSNESGLLPSDMM